MGQNKSGRSPKRIVLDVQLREALCKHWPDKLVLAIWGQSLYLKCEACSIEVELSLKLTTLKVSIADSLLAPIPDQERIPHSHEFTKYDENFLRSLKISVKEELPE